MTLVASCDGGNTLLKKVERDEERWMTWIVMMCASFIHLFPPHPVTLVA